jgi:cysteinyl-tRNA synthetase
VAALLALDEAVEARIRAGEDSPDLDNASATFRALVVRLGDQAADGAHDPREEVGPLVEVLLELREQARQSKDFATADVIRDRLAAAGVEVRDTADGSTWVLGER